MRINPALSKYWAFFLLYRRVYIIKVFWGLDVQKVKGGINNIAFFW